MTTTFENIWMKLSQKRYREQYALSLLKRSVAFQIKTLRKKHSGSQAVLAQRSNLTQGVVSRAEDQEYGNLTFNTVGRIAGGLDVAFIGKFVPFSELVKYSLDMSEDEALNVLTFEEENERVELRPVPQNMTGSTHQEDLHDLRVDINSLWTCNINVEPDFAQRGFPPAAAAYSSMSAGPMNEDRQAG